ncbi:MAG: PMT family glycosyltransferase, 4-amino-4-deoxy-L-arabinose transferase, partial [Bacteroidetes bacterium]|nr:PMT family glycosyltransferase, 4-amino-4-deoxy-L-arabinose transferase [Bacteroidota bacterium]
MTKLHGKDSTYLLFLLIAIGLVLFVTAIHGVYIIDEDNYMVSALALRDGGFTVQHTKNLTPSRELNYFDPEARQRPISSTPIVALAPPLYAFIALPFSLLGWPGFFLVNCLSLLVAGFLVFKYVQAHTEHRLTPWMACISLLLGSYCLEYAQGVWPHMLSLALCTGGFILCSDGRQKENLVLIALAGLVMGISVGVREQNALFAMGVGAALLLAKSKRISSAAIYSASVAVPLIVISLINLARLDVFHPFPKIFAYLNDLSQTGASNFLEPLQVFWAKVVDFSYHAPLDQPFMYRAHGSGAVFVGGVMKKAWLQSSPWIGLSLISLVVAWRIPSQSLSKTHDQLRKISLVVFPVLLMIAFAGFARHDGMSFNQRYFIELLPLAAISLALILDGFEMKIAHLVLGFVVGILFVFLTLQAPSPFIRNMAQLKLPLILASLIRSPNASSSEVIKRVSHLNQVMEWKVSEEEIHSKVRQIFLGPNLPRPREDLAPHIARQLLKGKPHGDSVISTLDSQ